MGRALRTKQADSDLDDIWNYIAKRDVSAADRLHAAIRETVEMLVEAPEMGFSRDELRPGLRRKPVKNHYLIYYEIDGDDIRVMRILHGARSTEGLF